MRLGWIGVMIALLTMFGCEEPPAADNIDRSALSAYLLKEAPAKYDVPVNINFDNKIRILGLDYTPKPLAHNKMYTITFYLEVLDRVGADYEFFGHFEPNGPQRFRAKMDHFVLDNKYPTSAWRKGDIIKDVFRSRMPAGFPGEKGILWGGFYKGETRMPIARESRDRADSDGRAKIAALPLTESREIKRYMTVYRSEGSLTPDGKLDEVSWGKTEGTGALGNLAGDKTVKPETNVKMLWDDRYLYIAFICEDADVWTSYTKRDDPLYREETTEVMIDADGSKSTYYELQVNAANAVYDAYFPERRKNMDIKWDSKLKSGVQVEGTLNKREDRDTRYVVEMAVPFTEIKDAPNLPPKPGDQWRINFYRMERPQKRGTLAAMWSPTLVGDFHTLGRFGTITFSDKPAGTKPAAKAVTPDLIKVKPNRVVPSTARKRNTK